MSRTYRNWCEQNNLTAVLNKYLEANRNQATIRHGRQWRGAQPQSGNGATPLEQRQSHGHDEPADDNARQQCGQWHRFAVDKPNENHALFGHNDSGE
eukprot:232725-Amphidinium_carterae.3